MSKMKLTKFGRLWILGGRSNEWSLGFNVTRRSIDFSLLAYWLSIEFN